jgi:hypothetical protein
MPNLKGSSARYPHGPSVKWPRVYEALRRRGMSKSSAAAISNAMWNRRRASGGRRKRS